MTESSEFYKKLASSNEILIKDFDSETFKLFLDCLMGFKNYSIADALIVLPVACKYAVEKSIAKCVEVLTPNELNENVILALNLALYYNCGDLSKMIIDDFLVKKYLIQRVFNEEKFSFLLEPESVSALLSKVEMDSYMIELVIKWGKNYLKEKNKVSNLKDLFKTYNILYYIKLEHFETIDCIFKFHKSNLEFNLFSTDEILSLIEMKLVALKSEWVNIKKGETLIEKFYANVNNLPIDLHNFEFLVTRNKLVFYERPCSTDDSKGIISWDIYFSKLESLEEKGHCKAVEKIHRKNVGWKSFIFPKLSINGGENFKFEVHYKFGFDCRIFKSSFLPSSSLGVGLEGKNQDDLYFTKTIVFFKPKPKK